MGINPRNFNAQQPYGACFDGIDRTGKVRQLLEDHLEQQIRVNRFGSMFIHTRFETAFAIARHHIGRHGDNRQVSQPFDGTDGAGRLQAVHQRHLHIHQHQVIGVFLDHVQRLCAIVGETDLAAPVLQEVRCHFLIEQIVFNQQDSDATEMLWLGSVNHTGLGERIFAFNFNQFRYRFQKHGGLQRFLQYPVGARQFGLPVQGAAHEARYRHQPWLAGQLRTQLFDGLNPIHAGHHQVDDGDVVATALALRLDATLHSLQPGPRLINDHTEALEHLQQNPSHGRVVINHDDAPPLRVGFMDWN